jgi:hypothetical protein
MRQIVRSLDVDGPMILATYPQCRFRPSWGFSRKEFSEMCDYSLHNVASRPAKVGDSLVTTRFSRSITRGFSAIGEPEVAVCLLPGTEIAFEQEVEHRNILARFLLARWSGKLNGKVARFRQINLDNPPTHHDALEFADGRIVLLTQLRPCQRATVLQLPIDPLAIRAPARQEHSMLLT